MANKYHRGAVSIFSVIFAALLLMVLTVGFITLMISAQRRALDNDLSQSAYDSALAGVEDAKRAVSSYLKGNSVARSAFNDSEKRSDCYIIARSGINGENGKETIISSTSGSGKEFNQAYTCVNIDMDSDDYLYTAVQNKSHIVPLISDAEIGSVTVEWFMRSDTGNPAAVATFDGSLGGVGFPVLSGWGGAAGGLTTPPVMRAQLISPGEPFIIEDLDGTSASSTLFLRPSSTGANEVIINEGSPARFSINRGHDSGDTGSSSGTNPTRISCSSTFDLAGYSCRAILKLEDGRKIASGAMHSPILRLDTIYGHAPVSVRVSMKAADGSAAKFKGVQPVVDSTGRANDLFRRVKVRLKLGDDITIPSYAVDLGGSFCKDFSVSIDQVIAGVCVP